MADDVFISTAMVETRERNDFWREITRPIFDTTLLPEGKAASLEGAIRSRPVGSLLIGSASFNGQRYNRDRRIIVLSGLDHYLVQVFVSGTMQGDFNGIDVDADVGDICILDLAQTFSSQAEAGSRLSIAIPRHDMEKAIGPRNLHGTILKSEWPMTRLITACLREFLSLEGPLPEMQAHAVQDALISLLTAALKGEALEQAVNSSPLSLALRQRILAFIDQNIASPNLSPEFIQHRFNVSRAHLYRAFAADGGVAKVLRDKRLDLAFLELSKAGNSSRSIAETAYRLGFSSGNHLLRSFRARFGMTPSEAREKGSASLREKRQPHLQVHFRDLRNRSVKE
jgi:AraC-like DNA-binding protein